MITLVIAAIVWVGLHVVVAGPLRPLLVDRLGEAVYRGLFSLASAASLGAMIWAYPQAPYVEFWPTTEAVAIVPLLVMPVALLFLVASLRPTNPTLAGPDMILKGELPVVGFTKITRHPMLWAFSFWAISHMIANGDAATWLLAGAVLFTALNGMGSIDRKRAGKFGEVWQRFADKTSIVPMVAVLEGRQKLNFEDIGWLNILVTAALYALFIWGHAIFFGVPVMPIY